MKNKDYTLWDYMHQQHDVTLLESDEHEIMSLCKKNIDWKELKENFYKECVAGDMEGKKVIMQPMELLNWFKNEIEEYLR